METWNMFLWWRQIKSVLFQSYFQWCWSLYRLYWMCNKMYLYFFLIHCSFNYSDWLRVKFPFWHETLLHLQSEHTDPRLALTFTCAIKPDSRAETNQLAASTPELHSNVVGGWGYLLSCRELGCHSCDYLNVSFLFHSNLMGLRVCVIKESGQSSDVKTEQFKLCGTEIKTHTAVCVLLCL